MASENKGSTGWNRASAQTAQTPIAMRRSPLRGIIAALVVVCGSLLAWLFISPSENPTEKETPVKEAPIKEVKPAVVRKAVTNAVTTAKPKEEKQPYVKKPGQMQLPDGKILTFPVPKEGEIRKVYAFGHLYECDHLGNFKDVTKRQLFHTAFEANFLGLAQEGKPYIPAFLTGLDEKAVKKMLLKAYQPIGDETEEEKASLAAYDQMRNAALDYMDQGGKFDDFVTEFASFDRKQRDAKATSMREVMTLYKEGKIAEAKQMAEAANVLMQQKGYKPITMPAHVQKAFDSIPNEQ